MTILALDLGTTTGWAIRGHPDAISGIWILRGGRFEGGGMRFLRFRGYLEELHKLSRVKRVVYEEVRRHAGTDAAHIYGGLLAMLTSWCEAENVPYEGIPCGTIKKHATGRGNANKAAMMAAIRAKGYAPADDNEADALAILFCVEDQMLPAA